jgi:serine/threonine-protein kinase RsbW
MITSDPHFTMEGASQDPAPKVWQERAALSTAQILAVIDEITSAMGRSEFTAKEVFGMRLALEEAGVNAIKHGHQGRQDMPVFIRFRVDADQLLVEIEDQGPGFSPEQVPDPLAPENLERPCGRGLLLMKCYTTWLTYNERGNRVTLCKQRSA